MNASLLRVLVVVGILGAGCGRGAGDSTDGAELFGKLCTACHGATGKPDATMAARMNVRDLTDPAVRAKLTPASIEAQIRNGSPNKLMPGFEGALTDAQLKALAAYVASPQFLERR